jgi:hypothetical protein
VVRRRFAYERPLHDRKAVGELASDAHRGTGAPAEPLRSGRYFALMVRERIEMLNTIEVGAGARGDLCCAKDSSADMPIAT